MSMALPYIKEVITQRSGSEKDRIRWLRHVSKYFPDIKELIDFFEEVPEYDTADVLPQKNENNRGNFSEPC